MIEEHYRKNYNLLSKVAGRMLRDWALGEDCVQETYEAAFKYRETFSGDEEKLNGWINSIFRRTINKYQKFIREKGVVSGRDFDIIEEVVDYSFIHEEIELVSNPLHKQILHLYIVLGKSTKETASQLEIKPSLVSKVVQRFKVSLKVRYG
jgi:RNA polymerase sigma factor (sigma-70 family)